MRRSGFTMVELIFVIIIIGILSVAAIPKFGDIKDRAKINSEYSAMSGLQSAIVAKMEFAMEDTNNIEINWNTLVYKTDLKTSYDSINKKKKVLSAIAKKSDNVRIDAYTDVNSSGEFSTTTTDLYYDVLFIKGEASNSVTGAIKEVDIEGKPDKNDVWVFNSSPVDVNISFWNTHLDTAAVDYKILHSGDMELIDINGSAAIEYNETPGSAETTGIQVLKVGANTGTATLNISEL